MVNFTAEKYSQLCKRNNARYLQDMYVQSIMSNNCKDMHTVVSRPLTLKPSRTYIELVCVRPRPHAHTKDQNQVSSCSLHLGEQDEDYLILPATPSTYYI